uniref:Uncharacterized protein n=1 Tax=Oryza brachyantha TaxID=4533 RepID=J3KTW8_ORYBR
MEMAAVRRSTPPLYNFLIKEGFLLPSRNRRTFMAVFALVASSTSVLFLVNNLAVQPLAEEFALHVKALNSAQPMSPDYAGLLKQVHDDTRKLVIAGAAYASFAVVVVSALWIVMLFAAVANYSGERHTFRALMAKAGKQLKRPVMTLAFVYVLESAYVTLPVAMSGLVVVFLLLEQHLVLCLLLSLLVLVGSIFLVYSSVVCSCSVVVSVADAGCHGADARDCVGAGERRCCPVASWLRLRDHRRWRSVVRCLRHHGVLLRVQGAQRGGADD